MNIICGENAQGKTNLIESIWLCTGCRSFRGTRDRDFIGFEQSLAEINLNFDDGERVQKAVMRFLKERPKERYITLNGVKLTSLANLFGSFQGVVFTPEDLQLSKGSPECRRTYMNMGISQLHKGYSLSVVSYNRAIMHRNAVIKSIQMGKAKRDDLDIWDIQLAKYGTSIVLARKKYVIRINSITKRLYDEISSSKETLKLYYQSSIFKDIDNILDDNIPNLQAEYLNNLNNFKDGDIKSGGTNYGVHRDDIITEIDGLNSRVFGSQGQSRSVALVMKLAQAELIKEDTGEYPVILLDDVLSELDPSRQEFALRRLQGFQVFVTCCDKLSASRFWEGKIFRVEKGQIVEDSF